MYGSEPRKNASANTTIARTLIAALGVSAILSTATMARADGVNHVRDVKVHATDGAGATEIEVVTTSSPEFSLRVTEGGNRLIVEIANADINGAPEALTSPSGVVGGILTQNFKADSSTFTRLSISLSKHAAYRVKAEGNTLHILLSPSDKTVAADPIVPLPKDAPANSADVKPDAAGIVTVLPEIQDVRFERADSQHPKDRIVVAVTAMPSYALSTTPSGHLRLEMKGAKLPDAMARTVDVSSLQGAVKTIATYVDGTTGTSIIEIDRAGDAQGEVTAFGQSLVWSFDAPKAAMPSPIVKGQVMNPMRKSVTIAREEAPVETQKIETSILAMTQATGEMKVETQSAPEQAGFTSGLNAQTINVSGHYTGRRIDLDLKDADIHNILRFLADVGRVNIVTADDVSGNVTIRMRNVPWDQALDVVLQAKGLGMVRSGNLIRVAPMAQLQKERELKIAAAKQEFELMPLETRLIPVSYASADDLQKRAKDLLSPRGSMAVDARTNVLISRDVAGNLNHIEELVRSLDTQTPQVLVEARIVEATSKYLRDVGIQWGGDTTFSQATGNPTGLAFPSRVSIAGGAADTNTPTRGLSPFSPSVANPNFAINLPAAVGTGAGGAIGFSLGSIDNAYNLTLRLSAAESSGLVRIVSAPRILTLDNRDARINQGTLIPFAQVSAQGVQTTFQEAKLQLLVKPHVTADGSVSMHVKINRDEPDFTQTSPRGDPTILKREAETDLLVMDGHTAVIGGIYTRNTGRNVDQLPFFGDIPILGILFQRRRASDARNELVIFITPRIVNRAEALGR